MTIQTRLAKLEKVTEGHCPTCGQVVGTRDLRAEAQRLLDDLTARNGGDVAGALAAIEAEWPEAARALTEG